MSGSLNEVTLIGHLGKDPEVRTMQTGDRVANMTIATSESWKDKQSGERRERTEWHRITIFNPGLVTLAENYLRKGAKVLVRGSLRTRKWQDQSGADRYTTEITLSPYDGMIKFLDAKRDGEQTSNGTGDHGRGDPAPNGSSNAGWRGASSNDLDDDTIPF